MAGGLMAASAASFLPLLGGGFEGVPCWIDRIRLLASGGAKQHLAARVAGFVIWAVVTGMGFLFHFQWRAKDDVGQESCHQYFVVSLGSFNTTSWGLAQPLLGTNRKAGRTP